MSKYDPLGSYLSNQKRSHIPMTFNEIEQILGVQLPASKQYPAWWSNNMSNNVMTRQWLDAGYQTESVDIASEKLIFRRVHKPSTTDIASVKTNNGTSKNDPQKPGRNPVFGCMKGTVTIPEDVDLTEPADPDWARLIEEKYPRK